MYMYILHNTYILHVHIYITCTHIYYMYVGNKNSTHHIYLTATCTYM